MTDAHAARNPIVWVHGDCLSPHSPALAAYPQVPALFVWDDALLAEWRISLKRIVYIYECLLELPVAIRRGDVAAELLHFAAEHTADAVITVESPSPRFRAIRDAVAGTLAVQTMPVPPLVNYNGRLDLRRFSRYWQVSQPYAMGQPPLLDERHAPRGQRSFRQE
jgi:hypothetical protein